MTIYQKYISFNPYESLDIFQINSLNQLGTKMKIGSNRWSQRSSQISIFVESGILQPPQFNGSNLSQCEKKVQTIKMV